MPKFVSRWTIQGRKPDGQPASTIFDILDDHRRVAVYPATLDTFAVVIDRSAVEVLHSTLETRDSCAVPARHATHGDRLLGLHPGSSSMELYLILPDNEIHIIYADTQLHALHTALTEILTRLEAHS